MGHKFFEFVNFFKINLFIFYNFFLQILVLFIYFSFVSLTSQKEACISFVEPSILIHTICRAHSNLVTREVRGPKPSQVSLCWLLAQHPWVVGHIIVVQGWTYTSLPCLFGLWYPSTISSLAAFPSLYGQELTPGVVINTLL